jgi:hypothetical protein
MQRNTNIPYIYIIEFKIEKKKKHGNLDTAC